MAELRAFLGITARIALLIALAVALIGSNGLLYLLGRSQGSTASDVARNRRAIAYICSTTTILDGLVVQVREQIDASFKNGTYAKLERQGIVSKRDIIEAHRTRARYQAAHLKLRGNGACQEVVRG